jgi:integrating conjugative element protein (TIGR03765 family)
MKLRLRLRLAGWTSVLMLPALAMPDTLIIVRDLGGASAEPYYQALHLKIVPSQGTQRRAPQSAAASTSPFSEANVLPVRSRVLTPGNVANRTFKQPAMKALFLIGDDARSRAWLREHIERLQTLHAVGFVVNVETGKGLSELRRLAPHLTLTPASGDDLARRLKLRHYPVLITAEGVEQ